jgi:hypothetical protein
MHSHIHALAGYPKGARQAMVEEGRAMVWWMVYGVGADE